MQWPRDMRAIAVIAALVPLSACIDPVPDLDGLGGCSAAPGPGDCVDGRHPFRFRPSNPDAVARGGKVEIDHLALQSIRYEIVSASPEIMRVENIDGVYHMVGLADGTATIQAFRTDTPTRELLAQTGILVEPVSKVDFGFDPAGDSQLPKLAALVGAREKIRIHASGQTRPKLAGAQEVITFAYEGGLEALDTYSAETRIGRFEFFAPARSGYETGIHATALGPARLVARYEGAEIAALPIEVVAAPDTVQLVFGHNPTPMKFIEVAGLVGTANGLPLAGLVGDFTATPPGLVTIDDPHAGELRMFTQETPGVVEVTATLPGRTVSGTLEIR